MFAMSMLIVVGFPVLVAALSFAAYVVVDNNHNLTALQNFTVLFLFTVMCFSVN